jgi:hypothetical protein
MSRSSRCLAVLLALVLGGIVQAQGLPPDVLRPTGPGVPSLPPAYSTAPGPEGQQAAQPAVPDPYLIYPRSESCNCPIGHNGPIQTELYFRAGPDFPVGGGVYSRILQTGWEIEGGGRVLFLNPARDAAWIVDLGIVNVWNHSNRPDVTLPLNVYETDPTTGVTALTPVNATASDINRTMASGGLGRDWWLFGGTANDCGRKCRVGFDIGGRYGSDKADFHEIRHRTDEIGGPYAAIHADLEWGCGGCTFVAGLRLEYEYISSDVLQSANSGDIADISLLVNFGVRF